MEGRLLLLDRGTSLVVRDKDGIMIAFETLEDFHKYYPGTVDFSGKYYIDYEPDKKVFFKSNKGNFEPLSNEWDGEISEYESVIACVSGMKEKRDDPYFGMKLDAAKAYRLNAVKQLTYRTIIQQMPEWKQIRWNEYMRLFEKVDSGGTLTPVEQSIYDAFPDAGETHAGCYGDCLTASRWIHQCIALNDQKENEIGKARSLKALKEIKNPAYPPLEF